MVCAFICHSHDGGAEEMNLSLHWAAMYVSEIWYSMVHCTDCNTERDLAYFRARAAVMYDRVITGRL